MLYLALALVSGVVMSATWLTFWRDLSYLQLVFIPLLFSFPRTIVIPGTMEEQEP